MALTFLLLLPVFPVYVCRTKIVFLFSFFRCVRSLISPPASEAEEGGREGECVSNGFCSFILPPPPFASAAVSYRRYRHPSPSHSELYRYGKMRCAHSLDSLPKKNKWHFLVVFLTPLFASLAAGSGSKGRILCRQQKFPGGSDK